MRAIDVDAFKNDYHMADECKDCQTPVRTCEYDRVYTKMDFCEWLDSAPTIEPRKKGRWLPLQLSMVHPPYQCSCCFRNAPMVETGCLVNRHLEALLSDFCPNCGAEMRGEQDG